MADEWEWSTESFPENVTDFFNETDMGNSTEVATVAPLNFLDSFVKSLSVILVSEIGDKTFFLAGTLISIFCWFYFNFKNTVKITSTICLQQRNYFYNSDHA